MSSSKLTAWIIGVLGSVLVAGGGAWLTHIDNELAKVDRFQIQNTDRISRIESKVESSLNWLQRIDRKIDNLDK